MALGTVTPVAIDPHNQQGSPIAFGDLKLTVTNVVGEASYTTGGAQITAKQLGFDNAILFAQAEILASTGTNATANSVSIPIAAGGATANLKTFTNAQAEVVSTTNVSGVTWQILAFGY